MTKARWFVGVAAMAGLLGPSVIGSSASAAQSAPPPTLTGETLSGGTGVESGVFCQNTGSFSFTVSGTATGPYSGTFTETGSGTVNPAFTVATFTTSFTINSPTGQVRGTKTFSGQASIQCYQDPSNFVFDVGTNYEATIGTSNGNYTDQGTADTFVFESSGTLNDFGESFTSSLTQTTLTEPTSKSQCKDGGYTNFPQFQNQGQCVSYVANGGHG
jgi:hypothetical protein